MQQSEKLCLFLINGIIPALCRPRQGQHEILTDVCFLIFKNQKTNISFDYSWAASAAQEQSKPTF
jgi:hypothetical protein